MKSLAVIDSERNFRVPGIEGKFFEGPIDNCFQKLDAKLQKEQP